MLIIFLVLCEGPTDNTNGCIDAAEKKFNINFNKTKTKLCLRMHYNHDNSYLFINGMEIYKFKAGNKYVNIPTQFCPGSRSNKFDNVNSEKVSFKENVYGFSVDDDTIDKSDILNIHK